MLLNNLITLDNKLRSEALQQAERITPLTPDNMFKGLVYAILSAREKYTTQKSMYDKFISEGFMDAKKIRDNHNNVRYMIRGLSKAKYVIELAEKWFDSGYPEMILADYNDGKAKEFEIRDMLAKDIDGIGYKCSSLFMNMCGYQKVVVVDNWALKALLEAGYKIKSYKYTPKDGRKYKNTYLGMDIDGEEVYMDRGITIKKEYLQYESYFIELADKNNLSQFEFKQLLWVKHSTWLNDARNDPIQTKIDFDTIDPYTGLSTDCVPF